MKAPFSLADIDTLKLELSQLIPNVKSSHRVEAMARGLGYRTHASLLADLKQRSLEHNIDDKVFRTYLETHSFNDIKHDTLREAVVRCKYSSVRAAIEAALSREPALARWGLGLIRDRQRSYAERLAEFEASRAELLSPQGIEEFLLAREFLSYFPHRRTINQHAFSYSLKHRAEHFHRDRGTEGAYVSNGALIAAAIDMGFNYRPAEINAHFNMASQADRPLLPSSTSAKLMPLRSAPNSGPTMRQKAWSNILIAAINAGLHQGIFGLNPGQNHWTGDTTYFDFDLAGLPAISRVRDAGFSELVFDVAVQPTKTAKKWLGVGGVAFLPGDAVVHGWLERLKGKWLQTAGRRPDASIRRRILPILANAKVSPNGYEPEGRIIL